MTACTTGFPGGTSNKNAPANSGGIRDTGSVPRSGRPSGGADGESPVVFLPGESQGQRSLVGYSPAHRKESDTTEVT